MDINKFIQEKAISVQQCIDLYYPTDAIEFIELCKKNDIQVYGLDAFTIDGNGIQPFMEYSANFSGTDKKIGWEKALEHLANKRNSRFLFEIIYDGY